MYNSMLLAFQVMGYEAAWMVEGRIINRLRRRRKK